MKKIISNPVISREGWKSRKGHEVEVPNVEYEDDNKPSNLDHDAM